MATSKTPRRKPSLEKSMAVLRGNEPQVTKDNFKEDFSRALNWYNANWEEKDYRHAAEAYLRHAKMKDYAYAVSKATFLEIRPIAVIGRLIINEQYVDIGYLEKLFTELESLKRVYVKVKPKVDVVVAAAPTLSVQERILEAAHTAAGDVEGAIDDYLTDGTEFSMKSLLIGKQISGVVAKRIGAIFEPRLQEIEEAIEGTCPQLKEGYSQYTKRGLKQYAEFMRQIIADCNQQVVSAKAQRKPRARKVKPAAVLVKKMSYLKEFAPLNLTSISAEKIIGASELWVYNTAARKLIVYYGADGGYLGVSGMSVTNYDIVKSEVKTLRKPEEFFKQLTSTGKRAMANAWKSIKAKTSSPRARINEEMILLAAN